MARQDKATDAESATFLEKKTKILSFANSWDFREKKYLAAVLDQLELMIAYYSYGNGEIMIGDSRDWINLDSKVTLSRINKVIKAELGIQVSNSGNTFPTTLWFE